MREENVDGLWASVKKQRFVAPKAFGANGEQASVP
jgi:hypothetical protein